MCQVCTGKSHVTVPCVLTCKQTWRTEWITKPRLVSSTKFGLSFETVSKVNKAELYKLEAAHLLTHRHGCHVLDPEVNSLPIYLRHRSGSSHVFDSLSPRGGYSSSSRAGRLGRTLWPQNSTSVAETEKGGQNSTMTPPTLEKGGQYSTSVWKVCKKRGSKIYNSKKYRGQNSTSLKMGVKILHAEKQWSKFYNAWK